MSAQVSPQAWIYLDVDGVLNAVSGSTPSWGWGPDEAIASVNKFSIRTSSELVAALNSLAADPAVRFHWLTTWEEKAPRDLCPAIGLDGQGWPVLTRQSHHEPTTAAWWKLHALREHLPAGQRAIWIDDDIAFDSTARTWVTENEDVVAVAPRTEIGLTRRQMDVVMASVAWARGESA